ncbi:uncharacterized protein At4g15970-like [Typha latifolia]|uniref:uncharacterized protein At4g15970-like n=1 Tax=Typha latifolia TaxID=4733 RepID=UPI003C2BB8DE
MKPVQFRKYFLLGAAMATVCLFLYLSADLGERSSKLSSTWSRGTQMDSNGKASDDKMSYIKEVVSKPKIDHTKFVNKTKRAPSASTKKTEPSQDLLQLLKRAAMVDKTILMTAINEAWAAPNSFLDLFLESFHQGEQIEHLLKHLIIVAMDPKAFDRCKSVHHLCYFLKIPGFDFTSEQSYMKKDYLEMMWGRNKFQQSILEFGYNFLFTDVDIVWFREPFRHIQPDAHIVMSTDFYIGDPNSLGNYPNGGFLYVKSSKKTVEFYKNWRLSRERFPGQHEQYVFDKTKGEISAKLHVKIQFLDTTYFGGFCQHGKDLNKICTMHANCCVGLENKLFDLRNVLEDWKRYKAQLAERRMSDFSWRVPGRCIH